MPGGVNYKKPVKKKTTTKKVVKKTATPSFRSSFASAKKSGKKTFTWSGKRYTTQTANNAAKKMGTIELHRAQIKNSDKRAKAVRAGKTDKSKSLTEIDASYRKEINKRPAVYQSKVSPTKKQKKLKAAYELKMKNKNKKKK